MPSTDDLIAIQVTIADRSYRLKIYPEEEAHIRQVIKNLNQKILEFKTLYAGKDMQDYVAMCLIYYATQPEHMLSSDMLRPRLETIEKLLDQALSR
ncbi:cell division protein ZapA [Thermoflavifilum aggregans]|uniref:Cell division protein ZapA n=1 Tax=Thermoflavifilum aggregans TaxID=454188 RepID=A0A2M9CSW1_9BACT|nr:cell division protein ZapA [Thermoflavifilum aggregans]MBX6379315.1 cell division protein ZapA [Thermoflavifilum aggregans]PJJ75020.1 cell division protein ZapA [Thermoflavifilum aggregans]